jgi:SAM-dependent methyltransferase
VSQPTQVEYWNGTVGASWVEAQESMDHTLAPLGSAAMDRLDLRPGLRVLDVGCGCGATTLELADRVAPGGHVVGVDVSEPMLTRARERVGDRSIVFVQADAARIEPGPVDRVFSRFGVMFFDDPVAAFAHLRGTLAPGGRMAFVCWRSGAENEWARVPMEALNDVLGPLPPSDPTAAGPFAFADRDRVMGILGGAGFRDIEIAPYDRALHWTSSADEDELREKVLRIGPAARRLGTVEPAMRDRAVNAVVEAIRRQMGPDGWSPVGATWLVTAAP